jgi:hypothetical protein
MGVGTSDNRGNAFSNIKDIYGEEQVRGLTLIYSKMRAPLCSGHLIHSFSFAVTLPYQLDPELFKVGPFTKFWGIMANKGRVLSEAPFRTSVHPGDEYSSLQTIL